MPDELERQFSSPAQRAARAGAKSDSYNFGKTEEQDDATATSNADEHPVLTYAQTPEALKTSTRLTAQARKLVWVVACTVIILLPGIARSQDAKTNSVAVKESKDQKTAKPPVPAAEPAKPPTNAPAKSPAKSALASKQLTGAELYSMHCNRCHPERYPTERTAAQWKTILLHMRVRANLPAEQARTILKYLQENSGR